jgi:hypothetical protein
VGRCGPPRIVATVRGAGVRRAVFSLDRRGSRTDTGAPFSARYTSTPGLHSVRARVTVARGATARTLTL